MQSEDEAVVLTINGVAHVIGQTRVARMMVLLAAQREAIERRRMFTVEFNGRPEQVSMSVCLQTSYSRTSESVSSVHNV